MKTLTIWCKSQTLQANYIIYTHNYIENQLKTDTIILVEII